MLVFYVLGLLGGIGFGWLQYRLLARVIGLKGKPHPLLLIVKLLLWASGMILLALWSIPVLLCFVAGATAVMLATIVRMRRRAKEE